MASTPPQRYALITGAASGLGRALALRLASENWVIAVADIHQVRGNETVAAIQSKGGTAHFELLDVRETDAWLALSARLRERWPQLDLLVNNAGIVTAGELDEISLEHVRKVLDVNLWGTVLGCKVCIPWLKQNPNGGNIVNVASAAAFISGPTLSAYNMSKAGIVALSETLASELAPFHIRMQVVAPGFFKTRLLNDGLFEKESLRSIGHKYTRRSTTDADRVASAVVRSLKKNSFYIILPKRARWLIRLRQCMPSTFRKLLSSGYRRSLRKIELRSAQAQSKAETIP